MLRNSYIIRSGYTMFLIALMSLFLFSCGDMDVVEPLSEPVNAEKVSVELCTNATDYDTPLTRAGKANETTVGTAPWVIVFQGTDDNATFVEAVRAYTSGTKVYVDLSYNNNPCRLFIIANAPAQFYSKGASMNVGFDQANLTTFFSTGSRNILKYALDDMRTIALPSPQTSIPYTSATAPYPGIPMSAIYDVPKIFETTTIGTPENKVKLLRIVAKVTVEHNISSQFTLVGATVVNTAESGRFYSRPGATLAGHTPSPVDYLSATLNGEVVGISPSDDGNSTDSYPIYIYESQSTMNASVIVQALYKGVSYYYRLAFTDSDGSRIDIVRNNHYRFKINSVNHIGYPTVWEALIAPPVNIDYSLDVFDDYSHDIIANQDYFLGVSSSEIILFDINTAPLAAVAFTIATNATYERTGGAGMARMHITSPGLTVFGSSYVNLPTSLNSVATTVVDIRLATNFTTGEILIRVGTLEKIVKVSRNPALPSTGVCLDFGSNYVLGEILNPSPVTSWAKLAPKSNPSSFEYYDKLENNSGGIFLHCEKNTSGLDRTLVVDLGRVGGGGRVRAFVKQRASTV